MRQIITCGRKIFFAGESVTIRLEGCPGIAGHAVVRTNLGRVAVRHLEVIAHTERGEAVPGMDWHDVEMKKYGNVWQIQLPLTEVGIFDAKCCFIPSDGSRIRWAQGGNFRFKVEPASTACGNSIYSAFVRQFGANCRLEHSPGLPESAKDRKRRDLRSCLHLGLSGN